MLPSGENKMLNVALGRLTDIYIDYLMIYLHCKGDHLYSADYTLCIGGNLAAAVAMAMGQEKSPNPICMTNLIYPTLQFVNFQLPSYRQNPDRPILDAALMMQFALNYIGYVCDIVEHHAVFIHCTIV